VRLKREDRRAPLVMAGNGQILSAAFLESLVRNYRSSRTPIEVIVHASSDNVAVEASRCLNTGSDKGVRGEFNVENNEVTRPRS
jgi:hypothetical protein